SYFKIQFIHRDANEGSSLYLDNGEMFPDVHTDVGEVLDGDDVILVPPVSGDMLNFLVLKPIKGAPKTYERVGLYLAAKAKSHLGSPREKTLQFLYTGDGVTAIPSQCAWLDYF